MRPTAGKAPPSKQIVPHCFVGFIGFTFDLKFKNVRLTGCREAHGVSLANVVLITCLPEKRHWPDRHAAVHKVALAVITK